tara:strand:+ start:1036 stop:1425 length:390 start_codon:yes stop_codon:yes gene_type:complete
MKIFGIGVDIVENNRFKKLLKKKKFVNRIFSQKELNIYKNKRNKMLYLSKRFSAKEAFVKSLGTGFRNNLCFTDISILNDTKGKPYFLFNKKIKNILKKKYKLNSFKAHLSLSDEKKHSISYVVLQKLK